MVAIRGVTRLRLIAERLRSDQSGGKEEDESNDSTYVIETWSGRVGKQQLNDECRVHGWGGESTRKDKEKANRPYKPYRLPLTKKTQCSLCTTTVHHYPCSPSPSCSLCRLSRCLCRSSYKPSVKLGYSLQHEPPALRYQFYYKITTLQPVLTAALFKTTTTVAVEW